MLTHLRNIMLLMRREFSSSGNPEPQWGVVAKELEDHLKNHKIGKILEAIPQHQEQFERIKPEIYDRDNAILISRICTLFAMANRSAANRDEGKFWFNQALMFNRDNKKAERGLLCILAEEGDPSISVRLLPLARNK